MHELAVSLGLALQGRMSCHETCDSLHEWNPRPCDCGATRRLARAHELIKLAGEVRLPPAPTEEEFKALEQQVITSARALGAKYDELNTLIANYRARWAERRAIAEISVEERALRDEYQKLVASIKTSS